MMKRKLLSKLAPLAVVPLALGAVACDVDDPVDDPGFDEPADDGFDDGLDDGLDG